MVVRTSSMRLIQRLWKLVRIRLSPFRREAPRPAHKSGHNEGGEPFKVKSEAGDDLNIIVGMSEHYMYNRGAALRDLSPYNTSCAWILWKMSSFPVGEHLGCRTNPSISKKAIVCTAMVMRTV
eukprot:GHVH01016126.1.p1 GENE.GHVH01016126.1~~GHVH01016126.1.p1  ORF type:complete len:123 (-),score=7.07 GHVH01016126.1:187-555(-)